MNIAQKTQPWGNSTGIRLPKPVLKAAKWPPRQSVTFDIQGNNIILKPIKAKNKAPSLAEMLDGLTLEKIQSDFDWGPDRGKEIIND